MGTTRTMENRRPVFEIPVWRSSEQSQKQDMAVSMPAQEQDIADPIPEQKQGATAPISAQEQDATTPLSMQERDTTIPLSAWEQNAAAPILAQEQDNATEESQMLSGVVHRKRQAVPIQEKVLLTIEEAAEYTGIGLHKLRELSNRKSCTFILWNGNKRMFKRKKLVEYLEEAYSI